MSRFTESAIEDFATVRIYYESRFVKIGLSDEGKKMVAEPDEKPWPIGPNGGADWQRASHTKYCARYC